MRLSILVTGAEGALGSQVARLCAEAGHAVHGTCLKPGMANPELHAGIHWIAIDVTDPDEVREKIPAEIDVLLHCAGGFRYAPVDEVGDGDLDFLLNTNLKSSFLLARQVIPGMKKRNRGRIVFVSAKATLQPGAGMGPYSASKAGINALTLSLAEEVKGFDITVNAVLPSIIDTPANRKDMPKADFSKWVPAPELAEIIYSLTQPFGKSIHGALIPVAGRV